MSRLTSVSMIAGSRFPIYPVRDFLILVTLLLSSIAPVGAQEGYRYVVRGRAVDEKGQPVPHARVVVDIGPPTTWEDSSYFVESDDTGRFLFSGDGETTLSHTRFLYVTGPLPTKAHSPINPPFNRNPRLTGKSFASRRITIKANGETDVGDVPTQIRYGVIRIRLQDRRGGPLITNSAKWRLVWLRVRDAQGKVVSDGGLSINDIEKTVNLLDSSVEVTLPEGLWYVDASLNENKGPWLAPRVPIKIESSAIRYLSLTLH